MRLISKLFEPILFLTILLFSFWLMFHTFNSNSALGTISISGKAWSDFGGYLPQIRSFSYGKNWPPQYPLFPGEPTRYHFLFYALAGLLEKTGLPLAWAINLPSALGLFALAFGIYKLALLIFKSRSVATLSLFFLFFNGSFSFLDYIHQHPQNFLSLSQLVHNSVFPSFAPWNGSWITAFWNLNIYSNQRHLGLSYAVIILIIYIQISRSRKGIYWTGPLLGLLLFLNQAGFAIASLFTFFFFIQNPRLRIPLLISSLGSLPFVIASRILIHVSPGLSIKAGYLVPEQLTIFSFFKFWFLNLGLHIFLIPLGIFLSPPPRRRLALPLLILFIIPNLFQLSTDMVNNHKFFNFFLIVGAMYSAFALTEIFKLKLVGKVLVVPLLIFLILGGIVDFFPVKNDNWYQIADISSDPVASFISTSTPKDSVFLNSTWFYHPASIAGRFIYNGYPYFTWSFGYDQVSRELSTIQIYSAPSKEIACRLLRAANIDYVELSSHPESFILPNWDLWYQKFTPAFIDKASGLFIYSVNQNCL